MSASLRLNLLGGFEAMSPDGRLVTISTRKNQALLAYLAADIGRPRLREALAGLLWSDRAPAQARDSLRQSLVALRRDLDGIVPAPLLVAGDTIALDPAAVATDIGAFASLARSETIGDLRRASELFRGEFVEGLAIRDPVFDQWLTQERVRLHDLAVTVLERLAPRLDGTAAVAAARDLARLDPTGESANLVLIRTYARQGQGERAVRHALDYRALLKRELGVAPSAGFEREIAGIVAGASTESDGVAAAKRMVLRDKAVIAVLPFESRNAGSDASFVADAVTDNIVTAISRTAMFRVVTRNPAETYLGPVGDARKIAADLGADYVLEGGAQQSGARIRLNARLIDTEAGRHIWADRYECALDELMDVQDTLARSVTASIETQIYLARRGEGEMARASAHELVMRARGLLYDMSAASFEESNRLAERAIALEPKNGLAHLILAEAHLHRLSMGIIPHDPANVQRGLDLTQAALGLIPDDEWAHSFMAKALSEAGRLDEALREAERALEINPSLSVAIARLGEIHALLGRPETAIEKCRLALTLNPRNPTNFWRHSSIALAHFVAGDYAAMLEEARRVHTWRPDFLRGPVLMAAALAALEQRKEAVEAVAAARALWPSLTVETVVPRFLPRFARDQDHERLLELLRSAGF